jgi:hypothetical protein
MITVLGSPRRSCDGLTRREALRVGALSLLGGYFNLPSLLAMEASGSPHVRPGRARNVILLYLQGGPATQDMFDLKPNAPSGIRSEFRPIATTAPGLTVCEYLPRTARWMHRAVVVRTVHHSGGCHNNLPMYTGYDVPPPDIDSSRPTDPPSMGSVCAYLNRDEPGRVPPYVFLPCPLGWGEFKKKPGPHGGFLGQQYDPFTTECTASIDHTTDTITDMQVVRGEPILPGIDLPAGMTLDALAGRRGLLGQLDDQRRDLDETAAVRHFTDRQRRAFDLLTSAPLRAAFDLRQEPDRVRDRYGRTLFGSGTLLARRLVERGARFVNVSWDNFRERFWATNQVWDTHERNFPILRENHLPQLDWTYSALLEDLDQRGLLDETLVVMMGEMGRTPRVNAAGGRDHWTFCYSVVLAGAGLRGGSAYGESDAHAAYVRDRPAHIRDLCATIYHCLGIDPEMPVYDQGRRPIPVAHGGRPLTDVLA